MADKLVDGTVSGSSDQKHALWGPYYISTGTTGKGLIVLTDSGNDLSFARTVDGGATWATTQIHAGTFQQIACWFDQETPGDAGTKVHIVGMDSTSTDTIRYVNVDIDDAAVSDVQAVDATVTIGSALESRCAISKARDGTIYIAFSTQTEIGAIKSSDEFATAGTVIADVFETGTEEDWVLLYPANVDDGDMAALFWDRSASTITGKMYDASDDGSGWQEKAILGSMAANASWITMDAAVMHSDGIIYGAAWNSIDLSTSDLVTLTMNPNSIADPPVNTGTTAVVENLNESALCAVHINQQEDDVRVVYAKGGTWTGSVDIVYKLSTNKMVSWEDEEPYSETTSDYRRLQAGRTVGDSGGFFQPSWFDDDDSDIFINLDNDVPIAAAGGGGDITVSESESVGVAETVARLLSSFVVESEAVGVAETIGRTLVHNVGESEAVSVAETIGRLLEAHVVETEAISVAETVARFLSVSVSESETISVAETVGRLLEALISESEAVGVAETVARLLECHVAETDAISVADTDTVFIPFLVIAEAEAVGVADNDTVIFEGSALFVAESESVSVAETIESILVNLIAESDAVSVAESVGRTLVHNVLESEAVSVAETVTRLLEAYVSETESVSIAEAIGRLLGIEVLESEAISVFDSEFVFFEGADMFISASDTISLAESVTIVRLAGGFSSIRRRRRR